MWNKSIRYEIQDLFEEAQTLYVEPQWDEQGLALRCDDKLSLARAYRETPEGRAAHKRYDQSEKGRASAKRRRERYAEKQRALREAQA